MGLPETVQTDREVLDWLNKDGGKRVFCVAGCWYSRDGYNKPHRRHGALAEAARHAMDREKRPPPAPHSACVA